MGSVGEMGGLERGRLVASYFPFISAQSLILLSAPFLWLTVLSRRWGMPLLRVFDLPQHRDCSGHYSDLQLFFFLLNCILLIMLLLLQLSQFFPFSPCTPHSLRQCPHRWSCPWVMCVSSLTTPFTVLYFISLWLFCDYQFVLFFIF